MIVGYDLACYSHGTGPCATHTGYLKVRSFGQAEREQHMREILRRAIIGSCHHPKITSIIATLHWGKDQTVQLGAGLLDDDAQRSVPFPHQEKEMAIFLANTWVGENKPQAMHGLGS